MGQRLKSPHRAEGLEAVFEGAKLLLPKPTDLSYYNWEANANTRRCVGCGPAVFLIFSLSVFLLLSPYIIIRFY